VVFLFPGKNEAQLRSSFSEEDIIEEAKSGNQQAFNQIIEHYTPFAYRLAYVILQNEQDAQDAVQDAFLRCYLKLASFHRNSTLQTWLYRVVVNCCTDIFTEETAGSKCLRQPGPGEYIFRKYKHRRRKSRPETRPEKHTCHVYPGIPRYPCSILRLWP